MARFIAFLLAFVALALPALADASRHQDDLTAEQLGTVHFPVSCSPETQKPFERGVALLHSFSYETAESVFRQVAQDDPHCAMAQWGLAMSLSHMAWNDPLPETMQKAQDSVKRARSLHAGTAREREYIRALDVFS
jgi:hypothetical protein